jgi:ATP-binding cassette subfamily B protein
MACLFCTTLICVPSGSSLAIVGLPAPKDNPVSLIPRIYDAAPGSVWIDGKPVRESH